MSDTAVERVSRWLIEPCPDRVDAKHWACGVAEDVLALEKRLAALEANRLATPIRRVKLATPAGDGDALREECERLRAENERLRQQVAAPIDVEAFRPEFEELNCQTLGVARDAQGFYVSSATWSAWRAVTAFADRLNAAARKEVAGE